MSLIEQVKDLSKLPDVLNAFKDDLESIKQQVVIKGRTLGDTNRDYPSWLFYAASRKTELKILVDYMNAEVDRVRGKLFRSYTENHQINLSDRAKDKYIDNEPAYLNMNELLLEVREIHEQFGDAVKALEAVGYALNNITKSKVAEVNDFML